jgi:hypothetical protein
MKNIKKTLNTNILETQINSSFLFILETKLKKKSIRNSISVSKYAFKKSFFFKQMEELHLKFPLQLTTFSDLDQLKNIDLSHAILLKQKHFLFTDTNFFLLKIKDEKLCIAKLSFCFQHTTQALNNLLVKK